MKWLIPVTPVLLVSCAGPTPEQKLMAKIEASVNLPKGAWPLAEYGRSYAYREPNTVVAVYLIPSGPPDPEDNCSDASGNPCDSDTIAELESRRASQVPAGESRWIADYQNLPVIADGGCMIVHVEYEVQKGRFSRVACNFEV